MTVKDDALKIELCSSGGIGEHAVRITHVGPRRTEIGGMQTVLRSYAANVPKGMSFRFITTYTARNRLVSAVLFTVALMRVRFTPRSSLGSVHLHVAQHGSAWRKAVVAGICRRRGIPVAATVHASHLEDDLRRRPRAWQKLLARCDAIGALSHKAAEGLSELDPVARIERIPNRVPVVDEPEPPPNVKRVLFAGAVCYRKGVDVLCSAWPTVLQRHPDAELLIAGPLVDVALPELSGVHYLGPVPPAEIGGLIRAADIAVLPSRSEGLPMFILEGMAGGRPVVVTDIEDIAELVGDGGKVVPPGCARLLADALSDLLGDVEDRSHRGALGRKRVGRHYNLAHVDADLRLLHQRSPRGVA